MQDRRVKVSVITHELGISAGSIQYHPFIRRMPRMLTSEQKACHQQYSEENLGMLRANPENFSIIITGNETWVHHHDPEIKQEFMQWKRKGYPTPKKFRVQQSAGKIKETVFSTQNKCILLLEFMPHKTTIAGDTYASKMVALCENIKQERR